MPSISLVVLRLEIEDGFHDVSSLHYKSEKFYEFLGSKRLSEMEEKIPDAMAEEKREFFVGKRKYADVVVETYTIPEEKTLPDEEAVPLPAATVNPLTEQTDAAGQIKKKTTPMPFYLGNPMVESTHGILHIYKHNLLMPLEDATPRSAMICMISVPAKLTCLDLQQFVGPAKEDIQHMQVIRDKAPNQYMVLIKFRAQESADRFYKSFNGRAFNSMEKEAAQLVFVAKLETMKSSEGAYLPIIGFTELPTCSVCLERMDESVEGILTILCNHSFHTDCLVQWSDLRCPVCRYLQTPEVTEDHVCSECDSKESLWICLICGHIGCGRYQGQHAYKHFQQTSHTFSMQLGNQRVWDYAGDNYVHRLVQTKGDGKLVSFDRSPEFTDDEKLDSLTLEYTYLLTSQLESQRLYFEGKMAFLEEETLSRVASLEDQLKKTLGDFQALNEKFQECDKDRKNYEKKYTQVVGKVGKLANELKEEKEINKCLVKNQDLWRQQVNEIKEKNEKLERQRNEEVLDLQEQVQDLVRHLETKAAVENAPQATQKELEEGQIFMEPSQSPSKSPRHRGKNKKR